jgi:hypothetical protein
MENETIEMDAAEDNETLKTSFIISDGKENVRVVAMKNCWGIQRWKTSTNKKTKEDNSGWSTDRYVVDLGMVANRIFEMRLKNSEATTLAELSAASKQIALDVRKEFSLNSGCGCKETN